MGDPRLIFQKCQDPKLKGYVALMTQFLPTFESKNLDKSKTQNLKKKNDQSEIEELFIDENIEK